jgi:hypothetical protein
METTFYYHADNWFDKPYQVRFEYEFIDRIYDPIIIEGMYIVYDNSIAYIPKQMLYLFNSLEQVNRFKERLLNHHLHLSR